MKRLFVSLSKKLFLHSLQGLRGGFLELVCPDAAYTFGDPAAELRAKAVIHDERFFLRALAGSDVGIGEAYMDGEWSSPDLVSLVRLVTRNLRRVDSRNQLFSAARSFAFHVRHRMRGNSLQGSRRNIRAHYDVGNEFYALFLDREMLYSSAYFQTPEDTLEEAQRNKIDLICRKLRIEPGERVLEIGCGWGAFAIHAARNYGAHVTAVTISPAQYSYVKERLARSNVTPGSVRFLLQDYRKLEGKFDKIVSIEMFEAVGLSRYDEFFGSCDHLLAPGGSLLLQTITMPEHELTAYRRRVDWIQTYIFPGSELAFLGEIQKSLSRVTQMSLTHLEAFGQHYATTLEMWRERFSQKVARVRSLGFSESFQRMWEFYMAWCEGAFRERYINVMHLLMTKSAVEQITVFPAQTPSPECPAG